jgi:two-component system, chemotaxis family, response regulator Rcp1
VLNRREILIVEDNPADVRLMQEALRVLEPPVRVHLVGDGDEALQFLRGQGNYTNVPMPSLIFLDFNLPKSNSREVLREIKLDPQLRVIPVAVLTTSSSDQDVRDAYQLYANCYLNKAGDLDGFFRIIRSAAHFWLDIASLPSELTSDRRK